MLFRQVKEKEILKIRNDIFIQDVVPILGKKGFVKSPFKTASFGRCNNNIYIYEMCRLRNHCNLEFVTTKICRYDRYIKVYINAFKLHPKIQSTSSLKGISGNKFVILPNSGREMWIDLDFIEGPPLFSKDFWFNCLRLKNLTPKKVLPNELKN